MTEPKNKKQLLAWTLSNCIVIAEKLLEENRKLGGNTGYDMVTQHGLATAESVLKAFSVKKKWRYWGW